MESRRPRNAAQTRSDILAAARRRFADEGYDRTTLRAIAGDVGVDAALVIRYFGSKQELFTTATQFVINMDSVESVGPDVFVATLMLRYFQVWEDGTIFPAMLRAAMTSQAAAETLNKTLAVNVAPALCAATPDHDQERIAMADALIIGLVAARVIAPNPDLAVLSRDEVSRWVGPVLRQLLIGEAPA